MAQKKHKRQRCSANSVPLAVKLRQQQLIRQEIHEQVHDAVLHVEADTAIQRALWLAVVSVADAYGFGPKRLEKFFAAFQENTDDLMRMTREADEEYAYEKLRRKAEEVTGTKIQYLYEHEMLADQIKHEKEGIEL